MTQATLYFPAPPRNASAKILHGLIYGNGISERDFCLNSFRIRLSEIRRDLREYDVTIHFTWLLFLNEFGRSSKFKKHFLLDGDKVRAMEYYQKINL